MDKNDFLLEVYKQANTHLTETDKKRDQVIVFFTAILAVYIGFIKDTLMDPQNISAEIIAFDIFMIIFGLIFAVILVHYRRWHSLYVWMSKIVSCLITNSMGLNKKDLEHAIVDSLDPNLVLDKKKTRKKISDFYRTEFWNMTAFSIISSIPLVLLLYHLLIPSANTAWLISSLCLAIIAYFWLIRLFDYIFNVNFQRVRTSSMFWLLTFYK